jgi:subfamily B ATP-binding cassette protein MsbA
VLPGIIRWAADLTSMSENACAFFVLVVATFVASAARIAFESASAASAIERARTLAHRLRILVFERYLRFGQSFFNRSHVGHLTTVLTTLTSRVASELEATNQNLSGVLLLAAYFSLMLWIAWPVTLIVLIVLPIMLSVGSRFVRGLTESSKEGTKASSNLGRQAFNVLSCIELVKAYSREREELDRFSTASQTLAHHEMAADLRRRLSGQGQQIVVLSVLLLLVVVMSLMVMSGRAGGVAGSLVYVYLLRRVANHFGVVHRLRLSLAAISGPVGEIGAILDDEDKHIVADGSRPFPGLQREIRFEAVSFAYTPDVPVLREVTFSVPHGKMTALVGHTGAGKSTLIRLLLRFYDVSAGAITIDGVDLRDIRLESLRSRIAFVSQDTLVLNASIRDNLTYGLDGVDFAGLARVIHLARLDELVARLPRGLETEVGERGKTLSGGERQRLAIARAMLKGAEILILDEATSALDTQTERLIQEAVAELLRGRTSIVIAHRLSTIRHADRIVVVEGGRVVEQGTSADLLREGTRFSEYWRAQGVPLPVAPGALPTGAGGRGA